VQIGKEMLAAPESGGCASASAHTWLSKGGGQAYLMFEPGQTTADHLLVVVLVDGKE